MDDYGTDSGNVDGGGLDADAASLLARKRTQQQLLQQQFELGQALLRRQPMQGYGLGGLGAGLANLTSGIVGGLEQRRAAQQLPENAAAQAGTRGALLADQLGLANALRSGAPADPSRIAQTVPAGLPSKTSDAALTANLLRGTPPSGASDNSDAAPAVPPMLDRNPPGLAPGVLTGFPLPGAAAGGNPLGLATAQPGSTPPPASPQDASSSIRPGGGPPSGATQDLGTKPPSAVTSPDDPLADAAQRDLRRGLSLVATGDPVLERSGEALLGQAQQERQMDFARQQAQAGREFTGSQNEQQRALKAKEIANERYQVMPNAYGGGFLRLDKQTGETTPIDIGSGLNGGPGGVLGSRAQSALYQMAKDAEQHLDLTKAGPAVQNDLKRLQFAQSADAMFEAHPDLKFTTGELALLGGALSQVFNGAQGTEGELNAVIPKSVGGNLSSALQFISGNPGSAASQELIGRLQTLLKNEIGKTQSRVLGVVSPLQQDPTVRMYLRYAPKEDATALINSALHKAAAFGVEAPSQPSAAPGTTEPTQPPGSFSIAGPSASAAQSPPAAGGDLVDVISPEGVRGRIPAVKLEAALKRGFKRG